MTALDWRGDQPWRGPQTWSGFLSDDESDPPALFETSDAAHFSRLVAYAPNGARLGVLPAPLSWSVSIPAEDLGAADLTYSRAALGGDILSRTLQDGLELALEEWSGSPDPGWVEPDDARFVVIQRDLDHLDRTDTVKLTAPAYGWLLAKIKHAAPSEAMYAVDGGENAGRRQFAGVNVGVVVETLLQEYETRGGPHIDRDFTTGVDSLGNPWPPLNVFWVSRGEALDVTIGRLVDGGSVEQWWTGRTLRLAPERPSVDRSETVILRGGRDIAAAPSTETITDLVQAYTLHGGEGLLVTDTAPSAPSPWGLWEGFASDERVTVEGTAHARNQRELADAARLRSQYARDLNPACRHRVGVDITVGDWVTATTHVNAEPTRVAALMWRGDTRAVTRTVVLNDAILDAELRRRKRARLGSDAGTSGEGSDVRPVPDGVDRRIPAKPTGLTVDTWHYIDPAGDARGGITADWAPVTTARVEDGGAALDVDRYEISWRPNVDGATWTIRTVNGAPADYAPIDVGLLIAVRVRARGKYAPAPGEWSDPVVLTVAADTDPPPSPSDLTADSARGVVTWFWDGLTDIATAMPADFSHVEVQWDGFQGAAPVLGQDRLFGSGAVHATALTAGSTARARARAVDRSGNPSDWTGWTEQVVASVLDGTGLQEALDGLSDEVADLLENVIPPLESGVSLAVVSSVVEYAVGSSETVVPTSGWSTATPTRDPGTFIWFRTRLTYGDASTSLSSPVLLTGNAGAPGADGTSVNIVGSVDTEASLPTLGSGDAGDGYITNDDGHLHVWDGSSWTDVGEIRGPEGLPGLPGSPGSDGVSVSSLTPFFRTTASGAAAPAAPTTNPPPAPWATTEPAYVADTALWRTDRVEYSNSSFAYTTVTRVSSYTAATEARSIAITADSRVTASTAAPTAGDAAGKPAGALWYRYTGNALVGAWRLVGGDWVAAPLDRTFIPQIDIGAGTFGNLDGARIAANTIVAHEKIAVGSISNPILLGDGVVTAPKVLADQALVNKLTAALGEFDGVNAGWVTATMFSAGVRGRNLVPDPSFEDDYDLGVWAPSTTGHGPRFQWRRDNNSTATATVARTAPADRLSRSGAKAMRLQVVAGGAGQQAVTISGAMPVTAGKTYRVLLHAVSLGAAGTLVVQGMNRADDGFLGSGDSVTLTSDDTWTSPPVAVDEQPTPSEWARYSYTFTATVTGFFGMRVFNFEPATASTILVEDVSVVEVGVGGATELTSAGLRLFDDAGIEVGAFVTGRPNYFSIGSPEATQASISGDGRAAFRDLIVVDDPEFAGMLLLGGSSKWQPATASRNIQGILDRHPWGPAVRGYTAGGATYATSRGILEVPFMAYPGRTYEVRFSGVLCTFAAANAVAGFRVSYKTPVFSADGSGVAGTPAYDSPGDPLFYSYSHAATAPGFGDCPAKSLTLRCNPDGMAIGGEINAGLNRLLLAVVVNSAGSLETIDGIPFGVDVVDVGPDVPNTNIAAATTGSQTVKGTFTSTWRASDSESYSGTNAARSAFTRGDVIHGYSTDYSAGGIQWGHILFGGGAISGSEPGKSLASALSGATIMMAHVELHFSHSALFAGGSVQLRQRTDSSVNHSTGAPVSTSMLLASSTRRGQTVRRDITSIVTAAFRGVQVGKTTSSVQQQYVRIAGHTASLTLRPRVTITYSRA